MFFFCRQNDVAAIDVNMGCPKEYSTKVNNISQKNTVCVFTLVDHLQLYLLYCSLNPCNMSPVFTSCYVFYAIVLALWALPPVFVPVLFHLLWEGEMLIHMSGFHRVEWELLSSLTRTKLRQ